MNSLERVAKRTRELRKQHGLTQQEFAEVADMSEKFLQQIESCRKKEIWLSTVEKIATGFGLWVEQFLAPEPPKIGKIAKRAVSSRTYRK